MKIVIWFWANDKFEDLPYTHKQEFEYSEEKRNEIINTLLSNNYKVMLESGIEILYIFVDTKRFTQR